MEYIYDPMDACPSCEGLPALQASTKRKSVFVEDEGKMAKKMRPQEGDDSARNPNTRLPSSCPSASSEKPIFMELNVIYSTHEYYAEYNALLREAHLDSRRRRRRASSTSLDDINGIASSFECFSLEDAF